MNNNTASQTSQQKSTRISYSHFSSLFRLIKLIKNLNRTQLAFLDVITWFAGRGLPCIISQTTLGLKANVGREHTSRVTSTLHEMGLIYKESQKSLEDTCTYYIHPGVFSSLRFALSEYLPSLKGFQLVSLLSMAIVTQIKYKENINIYSSFGRYIIDSSHCQESPTKNKKSFQEERRVAMKRKLFYQVYGNDPYGKAIRMVNDVIPLTEFGKIKLSAFPEKILMESLSALLRSVVPIKNPVLWLFKSAVSHCHHAGIAPRWDWMQQLMRDYGMSEDQGLELSVNNARFVPVVEVKKKEVSSTGRSPAYKQDVGGIVGDSRKVYVPEKRPERNIIDEYLKYEQYRTTSEYKASCHALGVQIKNPFLESILSMNLPTEEYERLGITRKGEEACPLSIASPVSLVQPSESIKKHERHGEDINNSVLTGISTCSPSEMKNLSTHLSTLISRFTSLQASEQKIKESIPISQPQCPPRTNPSSGHPFSLISSDLSVIISPETS